MADGLLVQPEIKATVESTAWIQIHQSKHIPIFVPMCLRSFCLKLNSVITECGGGISLVLLNVFKMNLY